MRVRLAPSTLDGLARLRGFLAGVSPTAANRMVAAIRSAVDSLATYPDRGMSVADSGLRELIVPFGRAAYLIRYGSLIEIDEIVVVRIRHSREAR